MVNLGIIGLGKWAGVLASAFQKSNKGRIVKGYSRSAQTREAFAKAHGVEGVADAQAILQDPGIDGVILTVPNELHLPYALDCLRTGKPIYIEKPVTHLLSEALTLRSEARALGVGVFVGHCAKLLAGVQAIRSAIDQGRLGEVCLIEGHFFNERALQLTPNDWRWYRDKAPGGPLSQIAIHQLDVLRYLGGPVRDVGAMSAKRSPVGAEVEDQWAVNVGFQSGALGSVVSSWTSPGVFEVRVVGTKGLMHYQIDQTKWGKAHLLHEGAHLQFQAIGQSPQQAEQLSVAAGDMFQEELDRFVDMILGTPQPDFDLDYGIEVLAMVEAAQQSDRQQGQRVAIAP